MTIEEILDKLEKEFERYFYYRHIKDLHSFFFIDNEKVIGGSLKEDYTDKDVEELIKGIKLFLK